MPEGGLIPKEESKVNTYYYRPMTDAEAYLDLAKRGMLGHGADSLTMQQWGSMSAVQRLPLIGKNKGIDYTLGDTANKPLTPGGPGVKWWSQEVIPGESVPKGMDMSSYYLNAKKKTKYPNKDYGMHYPGGGVIGSDMASGALSGASAGMVFGPWGAAIGGAVGAGTQLIKGLVANKQQEDALMVQKQQQGEAGQAGIQQKYIGPWATGGVTPNGMPIEVERGEVLRNPKDGSLAKISDSANTHAQGGVNIGAEGGTEIYGNRRVKSGRFKGLMYKEAADKIRKEIARLEKN